MKTIGVASLTGPSRTKAKPADYSTYRSPASKLNAKCQTSRSESG